MRGPDEPADAWRPVPDHELRVPRDQMVYLGDGVSDMPAFALRWQPCTGTSGRSLRRAGGAMQARPP